LYPEWWTDQCPSRYYHDGIDISAWSGSCGKRLTATRPGSVRIVGTVPGHSGLGDRAVVIDADEGVHLLYGHCERVYVSVGQRVAPGQHVADIGTRGYSDGCHVHFAVKQWGALSWTPPAGCLDPVPYMSNAGVATPAEPEPPPPPIVVEDQTVRCVTASRPDGGTDYYVLNVDGSITHYVEGEGAEPQVAEQLPGGSFSALLNAGWSAGRHYVRGLGQDHTDVWEFAWGGGGWQLTQLR
jgi:hypothetical protein